MTDEQIRLYAVARCVVPAGVRVRTISDAMPEGPPLYTVETTDSKGVSRWFGVDAAALLPSVSDGVLARELARVVNAV